MLVTNTLDDPHERRARPEPRRASFTFTDMDPADPGLRQLIGDWIGEARDLLRAPAAPPAAPGQGRPPGPALRAGESIETRLKLEDGLRILEELSRVLGGEEPGEGKDDDRLVFLAVSPDGRPQGVCSAFVCRRGVFIELLAAAPWNLLGPAGGPDPRAVRGTGKAMVAHAVRLSRAVGRGGRVALQAENVRCLRAYEHLGFQPIRPSDLPLTLVPEGPHGFGGSILRVARGRPGAEERRSPWLLLDPSRAMPVVRAVARPAPALAPVHAAVAA